MTDKRLEFADFYAVALDDCLQIVLVTVGDRQLAEDLVAEAFTRAWASWRVVRARPAPRGRTRAAGARASGTITTSSAARTPAVARPERNRRLLTAGDEIAKPLESANKPSQIFKNIYI